VLAFVNGKLIPEERATVSIRDHGFLYGDGVYETLRVYSGRAFLVREHLKRLAHSMRGIGLKPPMSLEKIAQAIDRVVRANRAEEAVVRLTLSRGPGPYAFDPFPCGPPNLVISVRPFEPYPISFYQRGIVAAVVSVRRNSPRSLPPHVKSTSCLNGILAKVESKRLGAQEGIMLTLEDNLAEGTVSNVFVVKKGAIMTPALEGHLLAGVTREWVCRLARRAGYRVLERKIPLGLLASADEVFLTNTTMEIMPVRRLVVAASRGARRRVEVGTGMGPVTEDLFWRFRLSAEAQVGKEQLF